MARHDVTRNLTTGRGFAGAYALSYGMRFLSGDRDSSALLSAAGDALLMTYAAPLMYGYAALQAGQAVGAWASNKIHDSKAQYSLNHSRNLGGGYFDTKQAYTMRQAGVKAMQETGMNTKQILGNEASYMHR